MILTKPQVAVLERLRIAQRTVPGVPVCLSRGEACAASRLVERGLVSRSEERGKVLFLLTSAGEQAIARQGEQVRMFARPPGIDDPREADAFRQLEDACRALVERYEGAGVTFTHEQVAHLKCVLDNLDAARKRSRA